MRSKSFKKEYIIVGLFILVVFGISLGYSRLQTMLQINGNANIPSVSWNVHFKNLQLKEGSFTNNGTNTVSMNPEQNQITYSVTLEKPGDKFSFDVDIANDGSLDAVLSSLETEGTMITPEISKFFSYSESGLPAEGSELPTGNSKKVTVTLEFLDLDNAEDLPKQAFTFSRTIKLNYVQKVNATTAASTEEAVPTPAETTE